MRRGLQPINVGPAAFTCNYDGHTHFRHNRGRAFIGSGSMLVALLESAPAHHRLRIDHHPDCADGAAHADARQAKHGRRMEAAS